MRWVERRIIAQSRRRIDLGQIDLHRVPQGQFDVGAELVPVLVRRGRDRERLDVISRRAQLLIQLRKGLAIARLDGKADSSAAANGKGGNIYLFAGRQDRTQVSVMLQP